MKKIVRYVAMIFAGLGVAKGTDYRKSLEEIGNREKRLESIPDGNRHYCQWLQNEIPGLYIEMMWHGPRYTVTQTASIIDLTRRKLEERGVDGLQIPPGFRVLPKTPAPRIIPSVPTCLMQLLNILDPMTPHVEREILYYLFEPLLFIAENPLTNEYSIFRPLSIRVLKVLSGNYWQGPVPDTRAAVHEQGTAREHILLYEPDGKALMFAIPPEKVADQVANHLQILFEVGSHVIPFLQPYYPMVAGGGGGGGGASPAAHP
jgi:hypothetical protein